MGELTAFGYESGRTPLHRLDPRCKLAALLLLSMLTMGAGPPAMAAMSIALAAAAWVIRMPVAALIREARMFFLLLLVIWVTRAVVTPGEMWVEWAGVGMTAQGMRLGTMICWRLLAVAVLAAVVVRTTAVSRITASVHWFAAPLPMIPAGRVATMMGLLVRFVPMIMDQAILTAEAQRARGIENRKNPVFRMTAFTLNLMRRVVLDADDLADAMAARCYRDDRTPPPLTWRTADTAAAAFFGLWCVVLVIF